MGADRQCSPSPACGGGGRGEGACHSTPISPLGKPSPGARGCVAGSERRALRPPRRAAAVRQLRTAPPPAPPRPRLARAPAPPPPPPPPRPPPRPPLLSLPRRRHVPLPLGVTL